MPLFGHKSAEPVPAQPAPVRHSGSPATPSKGFFSNRRSASLASSEHDGRNSNRSSMLSKSSSTSKPGLFHRHQEDPSISAARERVVAAENAEKEADRALSQARAYVREAKQQVRELELEAREDARLAKIKEEQAGAIGRRAKPLGREYLLLVAMH